MAQAAPEQSGKHQAADRPPDPHAHTMTRIVLRPIGSPIPLGLFTVVIASAVVSALEVGIIPASGLQAVALVIAPAFILQLLAAIFAFLSRDAIAATLLASFSGTWLVNALAFLTNPPDTGKVLGVYYFVFTIFILLILSTGKSKLVLTAVIICAVPRFISGGIYEMTNAPIAGYIAGAFGFILTIAALYGAHALLLEDVSGRNRLPIGRRGSARAAIEGPLADQLEGLEHAAGVRRTL